MTSARPLEIILAHSQELTAGGLDYYQLGLWAAGLSNSRILSLDPKLPAGELEKRLRAFFHHSLEHPILLVALDPHRRARSIIRVLLDQLKVNPEILTILDLQEAMGYQDPRSCSLKAHHLIQLAGSIITRAKPISTQELPVSTRVLVWGDSFAGMKAAAELARLGYQVVQAMPNRFLKPLIPCGKSTQVPPEDLEELVRQMDNPAIHPLFEAQLVKVEGSAGNFNVRLETSEGLREEVVGAMILAPELHLEACGPLNGPVSHPRVISHTRLEAILTVPEEAGKLFAPADGRARVVLAGPDSNPLTLRRALGTAAQLLTTHDCQVFLFVRDVKVGAPDMEALLEESQASGLIVFKLPKLPSLTIAEDRPHLTFFDAVMHDEETMACDLLVLDEAHQPAPNNDAVSEILGLFPGPGGFLQQDNVRNLPVITNRRGVYVAGPGRGAMDLDQAFFEADAAVSEVHQLLGRGLAQAPKGRAVVDRGRCVLCLTCHRLCPHGAVGWDNRAFINELACQGCGICASQCPNDAIQIHNFTDDQVVAAFDTLDPRLTPKIIAFMCKNSAWEAYQAALKLPGVSLPLGFTPLRMPCAGKIDIDYLLKAFASGADGVLIMACHPDNCKSQQGNIHAQWRSERAQALLDEVGVDPQRLIFKTVAANSPQDFLAAVNQMGELLEILKAA